MIEPELIASIAACFTTGAYVPQAVKAMRTRDTRSLSVWMYVSMVVGGMLWATYGVLIGSPSVAVANMISLSLTSVILMTKLRHG